MKPIRLFIGWVADHPIRFVIWLIVSCTAGALLAFYDVHWALCLLVFAVIAVNCYLDVDSDKYLLALLCLSLALPAKAEPESGFEPAGGAGVAVVAVVVGGVIVYFLVKTCQKVFPKTPGPSTNAPPDVRAGPDSAGSWTYSAWVSCYEPMSDQRWPQVTMELSGSIQEGEEGPFFHLSASRRLTRAEDSLDPLQFQADLARHGIAMGPVGTQCFGRNGRPAEEQETPIRFSQAGSEHLVTVYSDSAPSVPLVIQRSFDLREWRDFGFVSVPMGQQFRLIDSTTGRSAFYRIQPR
jgi:hypothetical protein